MKQVKYILVNESYSQDTVLAIRNSRVSDFRHSHIISAAGLSRPELISVLLLARKQWPSVKILGISEIVFGTLNHRGFHHKWRPLFLWFLFFSIYTQRYCHRNSASSVR